MRRFRRRKPEEEIIEGEIIEDESDAPAEAASQPRRGLFRRRKKDEPAEESVDDHAYERVAPDIPTPEEISITEFRRVDSEGRRIPRINVRRLLVWRAIRPGLLLIALGLVAGGIFWTLSNLGRLPASYEESWSAVLLGFAILWGFTTLLTRQATQFLAASALAGISISILLDAQDVANWQDTLVGVVLITIGLGIMARGLLLRQGSMAR